MLMLNSKVKGIDGRLKDFAEAISSKLSEKVLEDITLRSCFVSPLSRAKLLAAAKANEAGSKELEQPASPPTVTYSLSGNNNLVLEGSIREEAAEVLFETDGNEMMSLASMVLDAIIAVSIKQMIQFSLIYLFLCFSFQDSIRKKNK